MGTSKWWDTYFQGLFLMHIRNKVSLTGCLHEYGVLGLLNERYQYLQKMLCVCEMCLAVISLSNKHKRYCIYISAQHMSHLYPNYQISHLSGQHFCFMFRRSRIHITAQLFMIFLSPFKPNIRIPHIIHDRFLPHSSLCINY